jgi:hypothetical protein
LNIDVNFNFCDFSDLFPARFNLARSCPCFQNRQRIAHGTEDGIRE